MLIKKFYSNHTIMMEDCILARDCLKVNSEQSLIVNINEYVYIEHIDITGEYHCLTSFGKIIKLDLDEDMMTIKTFKEGATGGFIQCTKEIFVPNIIGLSKILPGGRPLENILLLIE